MKTFKLYSLCVLEGKEGSIKQRAIPLKDGLIINMENEDRTWHIDAVTDSTHKPYFEKVKEEEGHLLVDAIITSKNNHPATMVTKVITITELSDGISVLLEAKLVLQKDEVIEDVIEDLVAEGLSGEELVSEFKERKNNLAAHSEKTLEEVYASLQQSGQYQLR
ncbi:YwpF-like family protein [Alkalihalophilus lindianensis]|uniref:YwpF-like family protein n=1 Tax=Alkalihalophilus lindianensis TaxID=1630542 RepID=A0ABU3XEN9_9BACI|nr:YwpF-like family protein [Alkalihalophilus lindianensis]MDV2686359.1 YwpF-like family protein [Alkalihalophilus lindianensis]